MALEYVRHWICGECGRAGRRDPADRIHDEAAHIAEPHCCFCGEPGKIDMSRVAVLVVKPPTIPPLFRRLTLEELEDMKTKPRPPQLRVIPGGKEDGHG